MLKRIWISAAAAVFIIAGGLLLAAPHQRAVAQSAASFVAAIDLEIAPDQMDKFLVAIKENAAESVKEPGCRQFDIMVLASNPNHVFLYEVYDNEAAAQAHRNTDHFKKYSTTTANMVTKRTVRPMKPVAFNSKSK